MSQAGFNGFCLKNPYIIVRKTYLFFNKSFISIYISVYKIISRKGVIKMGKSKTKSQNISLDKDDICYGATRC